MLARAKRLFVYLILVHSAFGALPCSLYKQIPTFEQSLAELPIPNRVMVGGKEFIYQKSFGRSTASSFLCTNRENVVKIYAPGDVGVARFEYYATKFLREKGYRVAEMPFPPAENQALPAETAAFIRGLGVSPENAVVVVKKYAPGLPYGKVVEHKNEVDPSVFHQQAKMAQEMKALFKSGAFREWLTQQGVDPKRERIPASMVDEGDIGTKDFVLGPEGWTLIDP